jgi:alkylation response protein AidB-like acyl-CoA dehydrogenase
MDFNLNEFQREIADLSDKLLSDYCTQARLRKAEDSGYFDAELWQQMADAGLLGLALPESVGGMAQDFETLSVLLEKLGRHVAPVPAVSVLAVASLPLLPYANVASVQAVLRAVCSGQGMLTLALAESGVNTVSEPQTRAESRDGKLYLYGQKCRVPAGMQASDCWTLAQSGGEVGIYLFACEQAGVKRRVQETTNGQSLAQFSLDGVQADLLVKGSDVNAVLTAARHYQQAATAALATGLCEGMLALSSEHCSQRQQFGRALGSFQAVAHQLADCYIDKECLRVASEQAACQLRDGGDAEESTLVAAYWTTEALHRISHRSQQVHGGTGVDRDYPLFRYCLWARQLEMDLGGQNSVLAALGSNIAAAHAA